MAHFDNFFAHFDENPLATMVGEEKSRNKRGRNGSIYAFCGGREGRFFSSKFFLLLLFVKGNTHFWEVDGFYSLGFLFLWEEENCCGKLQSPFGAFYLRAAKLLVLGRQVVVVVAVVDQIK